MKQPLQNSSNTTNHLNSNGHPASVRKSVNLDSKKMDFSSRGSIGATETKLAPSGNSTAAIFSGSENRQNTHLIQIGQQELSDDISSAEDENKKKPTMSEITSPTFIDLKVGKNSVISNDNPFETKASTTNNRLQGSPCRDVQLDLV